MTILVLLLGSSIFIVILPRTPICGNLFILLSLSNKSSLGIFLEILSTLKAFLSSISLNSLLTTSQSLKDIPHS